MVYTHCYCCCIRIVRVDWHFHTLHVRVGEYFFVMVNGFVATLHGPCDDGGYSHMCMYVYVFVTCVGSIHRACHRNVTTVISVIHAVGYPVVGACYWHCCTIQRHIITVLTAWRIHIINDHCGVYVVLCCDLNCHWYEVLPSCYPPSEPHHLHPLLHCCHVV